MFRWGSILVLLALLIHCNMLAQTFDISTRPEQAVFFRNAELLITKNWSDWSLGLIVAYQPQRTLPTGENERIAPFVGVLWDSYYVPNYNEALQKYDVGLHLRKNFRGKFFVACEFIYRRWFYQNEDFDLDYNGARLSGLQSERIESRIFKFYLGFQEFLGNRLTVNPLIGASIRFRKGVHELHEGTINDRALRNRKMQFSEIALAPQIGFRVGFRIGKITANK